jgi:hypothetical protein
MRVDLSCPEGCFDLEVTGHHAERDDLAFLEDVALQDEPGPCPNCGAEIEPRLLATS